MKAKPEKRLIGWKAIANELGMSSSLLRVLFHRAKVRLPKIGRKGRTSPVYMPISRVKILQIVFRYCAKAERGR